MADENADLCFLGRQAQTLQGDVRDLRADHLRLDSEVAALRADISRLQADEDRKFDVLTDRVAGLEAEVRAGFSTVEAKINQVNQTMATNLQVILAAIKD